MASTLASILKVLNALLPFTTPGTPLYQDVIHTVILCTFLYFLPQIAERRAQTLATQVAVDANEQVAERQHNDGNLEPQELPDDHELDAAVPEPDPVNDLNEDHAPPPINGLPQAEPAFAAAQNNQHQPVARVNRENVGAKKARSMKRRDQHRAYHGWIREQAEARRAEDAAGADEREEALQAEKERRAEVVRKLDEKKLKERSLVKAEREERERREAERRVECERFVKYKLNNEGCVEIGEVVDEIWGEEDDGGGFWGPGKGRGNAKTAEDRTWDEKVIWVERLLKVIPGLLGKKKVVKENGTETVVMMILTAGGWIVRIDEDTMREVYAAAAQMAEDKTKAGYRGKITMTEIGHILEDVLLARASG